MLGPLSQQTPFAADSFRGNGPTCVATSSSQTARLGAGSVTAFQLANQGTPADGDAPLARPPIDG